MNAVRAKWRGKLRDKQGKMNFEAQRKMNEELRDIYSNAGVNPAGGCLPMLLQMPVLFAFYYLLIAAVELRGADWMLWIHDLSVRDPYYVLPLVMGGTQFLQQKMTPMAGDPMQRRIMMMMPVVFTIFFLGFPSGLVLYWLTNNVLQIIQQGVYNRLQDEGEPPAPAERPGKGKGGKGKAGKGPRQVTSK
jgi:YidC/Oxa1 family membrane protein insertase